MDEEPALLPNAFYPLSHWLRPARTTGAGLVRWATLPTDQLRWRAWSSSAYLAAAGSPGDSLEPSALVTQARAAIDDALAQLARTTEESLLNVRLVGTGRLPSTVLGLLFHAAEHTTRHVGQLITTLRITQRSSFTADS